MPRSTGSVGEPAMSGPRTGVYPGTFDPIHNGHLDIIRRATKVVDRLVIAVAVNIGKDPMFGARRPGAPGRARGRGADGRRPGQRLPARGLPVRQPARRLRARAVGAAVIIRGLRAVSDFEYEFQMAATNARLCPPHRDRVPDRVRDQPVHQLALRQGDRPPRRRRLELRLPTSAPSSTPCAGGERKQMVIRLSEGRPSRNSSCFLY